jgi:hypothetical protein
VEARHDQFIDDLVPERARFQSHSSESFLL